GTGKYTVRLKVPAGLRQKSPDPATILISRGDLNVGGVNFVVSAGDSGSNPTFVDHAYQCLLGRGADAGGLAYWSGLLDQGTSPQDVVLQMQRSREYLTNQVQALYGKLLHRAADAVGLQTFTTLLAGGGTAEQAAALIAGSPEYFLMRGGGRGDGFLAA